MSRSDEDDSRPVLRTVTPPYRGRKDREMDVIGWGYLLGLLVLLVPLLPVAIALWLVGKALDGLDRLRG